MSDDKPTGTGAPDDDGVDATDWLAGRFATPPEEPAAPASPPPPAADPLVPTMPPAPPAPAQPAPPAPAAPAPGGGFTWGLTPGAAEPPSTPPPLTEPPAPPVAPGPPAAAPASTPPASTPPASEPVAPAQAWFHPAEPAPVDPAVPGAPSLDAEPPAPPMPFETAALPPVAPGAADAPPFWEPEPTQQMDAVELPEADLRSIFPTQPVDDTPPAPPSRSVFGPGGIPAPEPEPAPAPTAAYPETADEARDQLSAIDALFGESQFREYTDRPDPRESPFQRRDEPTVVAPAAPAGPGLPAGPGAPASPAGPSDPRPPAAGVSRLQKILLGSLGGLLVILALVALFILGTRLSGVVGQKPEAVESSTPEPTDEPVQVVGPLPPGTYGWEQLLGGECLEPFDGAFAAQYTVVDCSEPHAAQLARVGQLPLPESGDITYPGEEVVAAQAMAACLRAGIFDFSAAKEYPDLEVVASYPLSTDGWAEGPRTYGCFVHRTGGEQLTSDIAQPQPTPTPTPAPSSTP